MSWYFAKTGCKLCHLWNIFIFLSYISSILNFVFLLHSWFHEQVSFSVHSLNQQYLSIPQYKGSWGNRFQETNGICKYIFTGRERNAWISISFQVSTLCYQLHFHRRTKEAGGFWWTSVMWRWPFILGAAILENNERNFFFG